MRRRRGKINYIGKRYAFAKKERFKARRTRNYFFRQKRASKAYFGRSR